MNAVLVDTGSANLSSVRVALRRIGVETIAATDAVAVERAALVVLPGVGTFGAAAAVVASQGLTEVLTARVRAGRRTLAICVGLQLLCRASEESPGEDGLGVIDAVVRRFEPEVRVPHMGWNRVLWDRGTPGHASFANSYRVGPEAIAPLRERGWSVATSEHGGPFVAALRRDGVLACQFHPELSGEWGESLLRTWVGEEVPAC